MKREITLILMILLVLSSTTFIVKADPPVVVKGYVYINNASAEPDGVKLVFPSKTVTATTYEDGSYILMFIELDAGTTGYIDVTYSGQTHRIDEPIIVESGIYLYSRDLYIYTSSEPDPTDLDPTYPVDTNDYPLVDSGGPYYEIVNIAVDFDGTNSYDPDGQITKYEWDFGDGNTGTGINPKHSYTKEGKYLVKLTVTDDDGAKSYGTTQAIITLKPDKPPNIPLLHGYTIGYINVDFNYTAQSTDPDNDSIKYVFDWGDNTNTTTEYVPNATAFTETHNWSEAGIYTIKVNAIDEHNASSIKAELKVFINSCYVNNRGYLLDNKCDGTYDSFYNNKTGKITTVESLGNFTYKLDIDENGEWDHKYNTETQNLEALAQPEGEGKTTDNNFVLAPVKSAIIGLIIIVIILIIVTLLRTKTTKKEPIKPKKEKIKKQEKKPAEEKKKGDIKDIEDHIDELLKNK